MTHGAGTNSNSILLLTIADHFAAMGIHVLRYDLPFRQQRRSGPPFGNGSADRAGLFEAATELSKLVSGGVYLGGHSYGGRQASILAVEAPGVCDGLLLLSYPLHPPKQPDALRTGHFGQLRKPILFVLGTNDPFASSCELQTAVQLIPAPVVISTIENGGHDLKKGSFDVQHKIVLPFCQLTTARQT